MTTLAATTAFLNVADTIVEPRTAFSRLRDSTTDLVFVVCYVGILFAVFQFVEFSLIERSFFTNFDHDRVAHVQGTIKSISLAVSLLSPLTVLVRALVVGYLLWFGALFFNLSVSMRPFFAVAACAQVIVLIHKVVVLLVQTIDRMPLQSNFDLGVNLFVTSHTWLDPFLTILNPFAAWYLFVLGVGASVVAKLTVRQAVLSLIPYSVFYLASVFAQHFMLTGHL